MRRKLAALLFSTALLLTAACGDGGADTGDDNDILDPEEPAGPDLVRVGLIPIVDVAPLFLGIEQGFFADRDIELETDFGAGGAEIVPAVLGGDVEIGFSNIVSMMAAPPGQIRIITNGNSSTGVDGEDFGSLMVPADSPVQDPSELAGATIAINTLSAIADTVVRATLRDAGVDLDSINFVAVPFPEMAAELDAGNVDAAFAVEPFQTIIRTGDIGRSIASSWVDAAPNMTVAVYFTSEQLLASDPDLVERFVAAMEQSLAYANENEDEVRAIIPTYTEIDPDVASELTLPAWPPEINRESTEQIAALALGDGTLQEEPDLDALLP